MKKGFTIIEILVVIAILGILASIVVAATHTSTAKGQPTVGVSSEVLPDATNYAVDTAGALSEVEIATLNAKLHELDNTSHQIAVVVVSTTGSMSIEEYGIHLAEKWKVGKEGLDNGAIIIIATQDRKVRIEVGKGLEGDIVDFEEDTFGEKLSNWFGSGDSDDDSDDDDDSSFFGGGSFGGGSGFGGFGGGSFSGGGASGSF